MILAIDIGNTNIVVGLLEDRKILQKVRLRTDRLKTWEEYLFLLESFLHHHQIPVEEIEGGLVSSVVPSLRQNWKRVVETVIGKPCGVVGPGLKTGVKIHMDNPASIGSDLIVDAVAALQLYSPPLVIFDLGTATTMTVIDAQGTYVGGMIASGLRLGTDALSAGTSSLPYIDLEQPGRLIGKNTIECMKSGAIYGHAAMMDGFIDRVEAELGENVIAVATGGLLPVVAPFFRREIHLVEDLTLLGLAVLYEKNAPFGPQREER